MIDFKAKVQYDFGSDELILLTRIKNLMTNELFTIVPTIQKKENYITLNDAFLNTQNPNNLISNQQFIQGVLDAAWQAGMRPIGFEDTKRETGALLNHLNDMRRIVFKDRFEAINK